MASTTYISIDVAVRSLAVGVYRLKPFDNMDSYKNDNPSTMNDNLNSIIQPLFMKVIDINNKQKTKDTSITEKAVALKVTLQSIDEEIKNQITNDKIIVIIEYQMVQNHGANAIFNMIVYHFSGRYQIEIIKPSWKNTIALHPKLTLSNFLATSGTNYKANKQHTRYNMLYLIHMIDKMDMINEIKSSNQDDIADTLMQCLAYHLKK